MFRPKRGGEITAGGMLRMHTPVQDYTREYGLWVKREDLACTYPGPAFSKTRGVFAHVAKRPEEVIGVLDTFHSQAGHAVARACQILGKRCLNFYPNYARSPGPRAPQIAAQSLGAGIFPLPAGRSCILFHQAKKHTEKVGGYMMPNALKLPESVEETAKEVGEDYVDFKTILLPVSSGTIAAGVVKGFHDLDPVSFRDRKFILHMGYSRSVDELRNYVAGAAGWPDGIYLEVINEGYTYQDKAKPGDSPPWPCNEYYDLKTFRWWLGERSRELSSGPVLFWNIG